MTEPINFESLYSAEGFHQGGTLLLSELRSYLDTATQRAGSALHYQNPEAVLQFWTEWKASVAHLSDSEKLLQFSKDLINQTNHLQHPKYVGHQVSAPLPLASLTTLLAGVSNNGSAVYEMGMAPTAMERIVTDHLCKAFEMGSDSRGFLTSGGTLANLTALLAARKFTASEPVWDTGMTRPLAILVSEQAHYCVDRAARIMGLGSEGIITIEVNTDYTIKNEAITTAYQTAQNRGREVIAIVGSAPSTSTGNFDDLATLGAFAKAHNLWFHIDAAHGGPAIFSSKYKHLLKGSEGADSIILDGHKMMLMPALTTAVLFKNKRHAYENFNQRAAYLLHDTHEEDWYNGAKKTFECTKTMMALPWYILLSVYGDRLFEHYIDRQFDLARSFATHLRAQNDFELAAEVQSNIVCFRYVFDHSQNQQSQALRDYLLKNSDYYLVQTTLGGEHYLRISIMNPLTTLDDLKGLITEIRTVVAQQKHLVKE